MFISSVRSTDNRADHVPLSTWGRDKKDPWANNLSMGLSLIDDIFPPIKPENKVRVNFDADGHYHRRLEYSPDDKKKNLNSMKRSVEGIKNSQSGQLSHTYKSSDYHDDVNDSERRHKICIGAQAHLTQSFVGSFDRCPEFKHYYFESRMAGPNELSLGSEAWLKKHIRTNDRIHSGYRPRSNKSRTNFVYGNRKAPVRANLRFNSWLGF
jgi:hypothetical protein